jgi:hypothetical protein
MGSVRGYYPTDLVDKGMDCRELKKLNRFDYEIT